MREANLRDPDNYERQTSEKNKQRGVAWRNSFEGLDIAVIAAHTEIHLPHESVSERGLNVYLQVITIVLVRHVPVCRPPDRRTLKCATYRRKICVDVTSAKTKSRRRLDDKDS